MTSSLVYKQIYLKKKSITIYKLQKKEQINLIIKAIIIYKILIINYYYYYFIFIFKNFSYIHNLFVKMK